MFLKTNILKAITFTNKVQLPRTYWILALLRVILTILPQTGYLHPDEFFQNVEVVAGDMFNIDVARTWEFHPKSPIRNIMIPKLIFGPPLLLIKLLDPYAKSYLNVDLKTPYFLIVIPRLFVCFLSFVTDYCLYRICVIYGQNFKNRLKILASSHVVLVYCCRNFSNSIELILFSVLLMLVAECMDVSDKIIHHDEFLKKKYEEARTPVEKVKIFKLQMLLPFHSLSKVMFVSNLVVIGIFNRLTFVGFAFAPIFFWLNRGMGTKVVGFKDFHLRMLCFIMSGLPAIIILIIFDSSYYGYLTIAELQVMKLSWDSWVVTPWNFLRYNTDTKNLGRHGLHSRWVHLFVNMPLLFNVLGVFAIFTLFNNFYRFSRGQYKKLPRIQSITGLMLSSLIVPVALLSLFPHQEARFIIPILLPLVYLYGNQLFPNESDSKKIKKLKKVCLNTWYGVNILFTLFYGFMHQSGIYFFTKNLHYEIKSTYGVHTHVITTHSYSIPTYLLQLESTSQLWTDRKTGNKFRIIPSTFLYKFGSLHMKGLFTKIDDVLTEAEMLLHEDKKKYRFYVVAPCSLDQDIKTELAKYKYIDLTEDITYYPHFCTEAMPSFPSRHDQYCSPVPLKDQSQAVDLNIYDRLKCYLARFCLRVYRVRALKVRI